MFKKSHGNIDSVDQADLDNYDDNYDFADDVEYRKTVRMLEHYLKSLIEIITTNKSR